MSERITRAAFLYLEPKGDEPRFAQCETCNKFSGSRCMDPLGGRMVTKGTTCGFYAPGEYKKIEPQSVVTPEEAGLYVGEVRCENCDYIDGEDGRRPLCGLYAMLNEELPEVFDLDPKIKPQGCCNAWIPAEKTNGVRRALPDGAQVSEREPLGSMPGMSGRDY